MKKQQLSAEQKRLETDLWIIALVTLGVFLFYAATGKQLMSFVANSNISVIPRLLLNAGVQFGVAGLGFNSHPRFTFCKRVSHFESDLQILYPTFHFCNDFPVFSLAFMI